MTHHSDDMLQSTEDMSLRESERSPSHKHHAPIDRGPAAEASAIRFALNGVGKPYSSQSLPIRGQTQGFLKRIFESTKTCTDGCITDGSVHRKGFWDHVAKVALAVILLRAG